MIIELDMATANAGEAAQTGEVAPLRGRAHIDRIATRKIMGFLGTIDENGEYYDSVHKQNQSLSQHIIADYHGRFLIELIQNGHDAHDPSRGDGEIAILLAADEGDFGTLYVANRGKPFEPKNVDALCEMGLSSKPPGEAVGNKGLGFRSVRHITDAPQIFSRSQEGSPGGVFDGYRFGFARDAELDPLLPDDKRRLMARSDLPAFYVPLWIDGTPAEPVADFGSRGFSTVIRLPIRNQAALEAVRTELVGLPKADAPMLMFLRRIGRLEARIDGHRLDADAFTLELTRKEEPLSGPEGPMLIDLGANGRFLVARAAIPEVDMKSAVAEGLESGALPQNWKGWQGAGEVAVAVPISAAPTTFNPRLYAFLPMGRGATSPFAGHLHGSFFPSSNRVSLDPSVRLNSLVLEHAIQLAAQTAHWLIAKTTSDPRLPHGVAANATTDLLIWRTPASLLEADSEADKSRDNRIDLGSLMAAEIVRRWSVSELADAQFVPCLSDGPGGTDADPEFGPLRWASPMLAKRPAPNGKSFSVEVVARHGMSANVAPIWLGLGQTRTDQLAEFLRRYCNGRFRERLTAEERAEIVESLAGAIALQRTPDLKRWSVFYRDLSDFMDGNTEALAGRQILICQNGSLRAALSNAAPDTTANDGAKRRRRRNAREASVFIPPRRGDDETIGEDFYPPAPLREFFAFLHDGLGWYGDLAAARQFLEKELATPFESEALLTRIAQIAERDTTKRVRTACLRWAFAIWRRSVAIKRPVALSTNYRLFVPTIEDEFIAASQAVFSSRWPARTLGDQLQHFLELAPAGSKDLDDVRARRIAAPSHNAFGTRYVDEWTEFLVGLGAQRGLQPRTDELNTYVWASSATTLSYLTDLGLPDSVRALVRDDIATRPKVALELPTSTEYDVGPIWWMPGQAEIDGFSDDALDAYAKLIVNWIGGVRHGHLWTVVKHKHNYRSDYREWPTPLAAFLRSAAWVPCDEPTEVGLRRRRCAPHQVWLSKGLERYPPFLRRPSFQFARALDRAPDGAIDNLRLKAEFRIFNASETLLEQVSFLAEQFADGCVRRFHERELMNIYSRCWAGLAERQGLVDGVTGNAPNQLLVRRRGQLGVATLVGEPVELVYVRDSADPVAVSLVDVTGSPLADIRSSDPGRLGELLSKLYGDRIRRTSELAYGINVNGAPLEDLPRGSPAIEHCPWLRPVLAVALEALDSVELNRLPADRSAIMQSLDRIELQQWADVRFVLEGQDVTPPTARPVYRFERNGETLVILTSETALTWSQIESVLPAIGDVIEQPTVVPHTRLLVRQLSLESVPIDDKPTGHSDLVRLGQMLDLSEHAMQAARDSLGEKIDRQLPWFRAVVFHLGGEPGLERWAQGELAAIDDHAVLIELVHACLPPGSISPEEVIEAAKVSFSTDELRRRLDLDFASFNASLLATGSPPDIDPEGQSSQLNFFIEDHRLAISTALRNMVARSVSGFTPDPRYKLAESALSELKPDPGWLQQYERIPDELLLAFVESWLLEMGAPQLGENPHGLGELSVVRAANAAALKQVARKAQPLVRAWSVQKSVPVHPLWQDPTQTEVELRRRLDEAGAFDCRKWTDPEFLSWFAQLGLWPADMKLTLDRNELGVAETELEAEAQKAREKRDELAKGARSVSLNGNDRDPQNVDWLKLSEEVAGALSKKLLNRPIGTFSNLAPAPDTTRTERGGYQRGRGGTYVGVPQEKKDMIGRLGELTVYHWLKARQPGQDIDRCWVSGNAAVFTGREGADGLGYDFCIPFNKQTWYIEVKASIDDPCQFELGETEVRWARDVARSRAAVRYVIAYVANVGQTGNSTIDILPNPLGPDADGLLSIAGDTIRFRFDRNS